MLAYNHKQLPKKWWFSIQLYLFIDMDDLLGEDASEMFLLTSRRSDDGNVKLWPRIVCAFIIHSSVCLSISAALTQTFVDDLTTPLGVPSAGKHQGVANRNEQFGKPCTVNE